MRQQIDTVRLAKKYVTEHPGACKVILPAMSLYYEVRYGEDKGLRLTPHRYRDKRFRVRKKPGEPWVPIEERDIESYLAKGYILRMSAKGHSPSGIRRESIKGRKSS